MDTLSPYPRCADAADFFARLMTNACLHDPALSALSARMSHAGVDILALVDHWTLPASPNLLHDLTAWGFVEQAPYAEEPAWTHPLARLPHVRVGRKTTVALAVDDIAHFFKQSGLVPVNKQGDTDSAYETVDVQGAHFHVVARRGYRGFRPGKLDQASHDALAYARRAFRERPRSGDEGKVICRAAHLWKRTAELFGIGRATDEFFEGERDYYLQRNAAARWQGERQQSVGIGWANHDHHTYRSSREGFQPLMKLWQAMGFTFRERFYAGADAEWGAQILEHPTSRVVLFCDVDMAPAELDIDFIQTPLPPRDTLGTIGLWCALHGSSIADAGMHHLECEFDFQKCEDNLKAAGFGVMRPFTDLPILKQAFTVPEMWPVTQERLTYLVQNNLIGFIAAEKFAEQGAAGSHLEILQRWEGFKGFNKTGVSKIIRDTDARYVAGAA